MPKDRSFDGDQTLGLKLVNYFGEQFMDFRYKWKNGQTPTQDEAARSQSLLDESQFDNECDRKLAEENARRHLGVPIRIPDDEKSVLPHAIDSGEQADINEV